VKRARTVQRSCHVQSLSTLCHAFRCCGSNSTRHSLIYIALLLLAASCKKVKDRRNRRRTTASQHKLRHTLQLDQWDRPQREAYQAFRPRDGVRCRSRLSDSGGCSLANPLGQVRLLCVRNLAHEPTSVYSPTRVVVASSSLSAPGC
jgi:hypothetical protein